ncbi:MAG: hypothetical protein SGPRY_008123, partial [Prymnesium sp.]
GETAAALEILKATNSYGQLALCDMRENKKGEALARALKVKDRFKGVRTKYYVLKAFASTAEVCVGAGGLLSRSRRGAEARGRWKKGGWGGGGEEGVRRWGRRGVGRREDGEGESGEEPSLSRCRRQLSRKSSISKLWLSKSKGPSASGNISEIDLADEQSLREIAVKWIDKLEQASKPYIGHNPDSDPDTDPYPEPQPLCPNPKSAPFP